MQLLLLPIPGHYIVAEDDHAEDEDDRGAVVLFFFPTISIPCA